MKTITIEVEDNYFSEILNRLKDLPIKILQEKNTEKKVIENRSFWSATYINQVLGQWQGDLQRPEQTLCEERELF